MRDSTFAARWKQLLLVAVCVSGAAFSAASQADDKRHHDHGGKFRDHHVHYSSGRHHRRHDREHHHRSHGHREHDRYDWHDHHRSHRHRRHHYRSHDGWHYREGRYWAPPHYRGRYCTDRRHYHGVHYHVAVTDYYDYYYPRYRYYGPHPYGANASVIISIPLF